MREELDKKLCKDFPKIFTQISLLSGETCMCWGFECRDGWFKIIYKLCSDIQKHCDSTPETCQVEASQVKEKYGGLRFYITGGDDFIYDLIDKAESESYKTCESCGSIEEVTQTNGWVESLCEECLDKRNGVVRGYN
jgi:hypothetical protein